MATIQMQNIYQVTQHFYWIEFVIPEIKIFAEKKEISNCKWNLKKRNESVSRFQKRV